MANKLELTWYGKDEPIVVEPRLLIEDATRSNCATDPETENMLIHGDNLLALKALESKYAGRVKCIYIDPPYNTGAAFEQYNDNLEHSIWLNLMKPRFELLRRLLSDNGSLWVNLDDNEVHYCKVLLDDIFGRSNFLCDIAWENGILLLQILKISDGYTIIFWYTESLLHSQEICFPSLMIRSVDTRIQTMILVAHGKQRIIPVDLLPNRDQICIIPSFNL